MIDTKEYIIDQAFDLFLTRSYEAVSISDISKAIGLTKGALYHHFSSKEELFRAVLDKYLVIIGTECDVNKSSLLEYNQAVINNMKRTLNALFGNKPQLVPINYLNLIADGFRHYKGFAEDKKNLFNTEIENTKKILDNAIERGEIRNDINTSVISLTYFSAAVGLAGNLLQDFSIEETVKSLEDQLAEFYRLLKT